MSDEGGPSDASAARPAAPPARPGRDAYCEIAVVLAVVWAPSVYGSIRDCVRAGRNEPPRADHVYALIADAGSIALILWIARRAGVSWSALGCRRFRIVDLAAGVLFAYLGYVVSRVVRMLLAATGLLPLLDRLAPNPHTLVFPELAAGAWFVPALAVSVTFEELLYRSYLVSRLRPLLGGGRAVLVSAILFGAVHLYQGAVAAVIIAAIGAFYSLVLRLGGLTWVLLAHFLYDLWISGLLDFLRP
jgi:membrane protease YdiL (CAAX protease family)